MTDAELTVEEIKLLILIDKKIDENDEHAEKYFSKLLNLIYKG